MSIIKGKYTKKKSNAKKIKKYRANLIAHARKARARREIARYIIL